IVTLTPDPLDPTAPPTVTFTPDDGWHGNTTFEYTVVTDKGTPEKATVGLTVIGVGIVDDNSPGTPGAGDGTLATIDDLEHVAITGQGPKDGSITKLTVTDGSGN